ncbi:hypothetical protein JKP88DRAFT_351333 [Tribonema minus]|uniref:Small-subunit processome Utp21 domain-containing protein n=1 Tax=Tribonema minus TaxID=303371 RepID=A0A835YID8_9STRA|nr:hypothetical protein JKP88DRAFT_351333 [Tribonema minus]
MSSSSESEDLELEQANINSGSDESDGEGEQRVAKQQGASHSAAPPGAAASKLYYPFRTLGMVTDGVQFVVRRRGEECFVTTSIGKSFQVYRCDHLRLSMSSQPAHNRRIRCMAARGDELTYAGCGREVLCWHRLACNGAIAKPHPGEVTALVCIGDMLVSVCSKGVLRSYDVKYKAPPGGLTPLSDVELPGGFATPTVLAHPPTYLNKVVIGSEQGGLGLWNVRTGNTVRSSERKCVHIFKCLDAPELLSTDDNADGADAKSGCSSAITALEASPALDVVAVGRRSGLIALVHLRQDTVLFSLRQSREVTCLRRVVEVVAGAAGGGDAAGDVLQAVVEVADDAGSADVDDAGDMASAALPMLASGSDCGRVHVWDLQKRRMHHTMTCHEPVLLTASPDNSLRMWVFDAPDGTARQLRSRPAGRAAPRRVRVYGGKTSIPRHVRFYGGETTIGHAAPPRRVRFYGGETTAAEADAGSGDALCLLSAGGDGAFRRFHAMRDALSVEFSQKQLMSTTMQHRIAHRNKGRLGPVIAFDACETRARDWHNICTCHEEDANAYVWSYKDRAAGKMILRQKHWPGNAMKTPPNPSHFASSVAISACGNFALVGIPSLTTAACGNFALVGTRGGPIFKYNMQSGLERGSFPQSATQAPRAATSGGKPRPGSVARIDATNKKALTKAGAAMAGDEDAAALNDEADVRHTGAVQRLTDAAALDDGAVDVRHTGAVQGLATDAFNAAVASGGLDGKVIFWDFQTHQALAEIATGAGVSQLELVRDSGLLAAACDDSVVRIYDFATRKLVRRLPGHGGPIVDMVFTADSRRLAVAAADSTIRVWDLPTGKCVDWLKFAKPVTSLTTSPTGEFLCTSHQDRLGLSVWADRSFFQPVYLDSTPTAPILMDQPPPAVEDEGGVDTGVDASGGYAQDKRALRGAAAVDAETEAQIDTDIAAGAAATRPAHGSDLMETEAQIDTDIADAAARPDGSGLMQTEAHIDTDMADAAAPQVSVLSVAARAPDGPDLMWTEAQMSKDIAAAAAAAVATRPDGARLITLSSLPRAYWASLFQLELIKARNRPQQPPQKPPQAPFFLPTTHKGGAMEPSFEAAAPEEIAAATAAANSAPAAANTRRAAAAAAVDAAPAAATHGEPDPAGWGAVWSDDEELEKLGDSAQQQGDKQGVEAVLEGGGGAAAEGKAGKKQRRKKRKAEADLVLVRAAGDAGSRIMHSGKMGRGDAVTAARRRLLLQRCRMAELLHACHEGASTGAAPDYASVMKRLTSLGPSAVDVEVAALDYASVMKRLMSPGPSAVDVEMAALCTGAQDAEGVQLLRLTADFLLAELSFEVVQAYMHRFLKLHAEAIMATPELRAAAAALRAEQAASMRVLSALVQENLCLVQFLTDVHT